MQQDHCRSGGLRTVCFVKRGLYCFSNVPVLAGTFVSVLPSGCLVSSSMGSGDSRMKKVGGGTAGPRKN